MSKTKKNLLKNPIKLRNKQRCKIYSQNKIDTLKERQGETAWQTYIQTERQSDSQSESHTVRQSESQTDSQTDRQADR